MTVSNLSLFKRPNGQLFYPHLFVYPQSSASRGNGSLTTTHPQITDKVTSWTREPNRNP